MGALLGILGLLGTTAQHAPGLEIKRECRTSPNSSSSEEEAPKTHLVPTRDNAIP